MPMLVGKFGSPTKVLFTDLVNTYSTRPKCETSPHFMHFVITHVHVLLDPRRTRPLTPSSSFPHRPSSNFLAPSEFIVSAPPLCPQCKPSQPIVPPRKQRKPTYTPQCALQPPHTTQSSHLIIHSVGKKKPYHHHARRRHRPQHLLPLHRMHILPPTPSHQQTIRP